MWVVCGGEDYDVSDRFCELGSWGLRDGMYTYLMSLKKRLGRLVIDLMRDG